MPALQYVLSHQKEQVRFPGISVEMERGGSACHPCVSSFPSVKGFVSRGSVSIITKAFCICAGETVAWILPFTSGGFLYIALVNVVPDLLEEKNPW